MSTLHAVKGFADLFAPESSLYTLMETTARKIFGAYGYKELRTPILEYSELFSRSIGTETDVVQKEMFTMEDRKGRILSMRPEATAGVMRAYLEHNCRSREAISKYFCYGPMFRYERPQKGRMRQFHQLDCECLGVEDPHVDAEMLLMLMHFFKELGIDGLSLEINTLGCRECRPAYKELLKNYLEQLDTTNLCDDCKRRLGSNPLRVLDCKAPGCKKLTEYAPTIAEHVCLACAEHFAIVIGVLQRQAIPYVLNPRLVRGLDYYSRTTFEVVSSNIGAQGSVAGGGRYDGLAEDIGGQAVPGIGFACGMERLALALGETATEKIGMDADFYIVLLDERGANTALEVAQTLRYFELRGEMAYTVKSVKSQMRQASKTNARFCILIGETEIETGTVQIKNMITAQQHSLPLDELAAWAASCQ